MFENLNKHRHIVVTGPQRSGTTICTKMIADSLGHQCILEEEFSTDNVRKDFNLLYMRLQDKKDSKAVYQVPALSAYVHLLPAHVAVVFMIRSESGIRASQNRIGWPDEQRMLSRYFRIAGPISSVKYEVWKLWQKPCITHAYEIEYESLKGHHLWINEGLRRSFGPRTTERV